MASKVCKHCNGSGDCPDCGASFEGCETCGGREGLGICPHCDGEGMTDIDDTIVDVGDASEDYERWEVANDYF